MTSTRLNAPTRPRPVTGAPEATSGPPALNTTHTSPDAAVMVGWSTKRKVVLLPGGLAMLAITLKCNPPSVLSATGSMLGTALPTRYRYERNRLPFSSKDIVGSQQADPRLSLSAMIEVVQVAPPSKLTPSKSPEPC